MTWIVPKLDWLSTDKINFADFNRIENNAQEVATYLNSINYPFTNYVMSFDGVDDYVSIPHQSSLSIGSVFTVEAWIKPTSLPARQIIYSTRVNNPAGSWQVEVGTASGGVNRIAVTGLGTFVVETVDNALTLGIWQHIAVVMNGGGGADKIYVNGVSQTIFQFNAYTLIDNTDLKTIGGAPTALWLNGYLRDIRLWNVARTQTQIQDNMNAVLTGNEIGLNGYWKLNEGNGILTNDTTTNRNNGTLTNGPTWASLDPAKPAVFGGLLNRDRASVDKLASINRIEQILETIRTHFLTPPNYLGTRVWTVSSLFDYNDAIRLESNVNDLYTMGILIVESFKICGTFYAGEDGLIY